MNNMKNIYYRDKEPANVNELYKKARFLLLYCQIDINFKSYGNLHTPHRFFEVNNWGNLVIRDINVNDYNANLRIEIPKYAPFNYS